jgi:preprotein translocase subunit SecB
MTMTEKYKILGKYIKDMSSETPDVETYIFVKDHISKYQLGIDINSKALKNKMIEVNTLLKFEDKEQSEKKSYFEINFSTIIKINDEIKEKKGSRKNYFM